MQAEGCGTGGFYFYLPHRPSRVRASVGASVRGKKGRTGDEGAGRGRQVRKGKEKGKETKANGKADDLTHRMKMTWERASSGSIELGSIHGRESSAAAVY